MISFYLLFIIFSNAKGVPSELEENDLSRIQDLSPEIKSEDSVNVENIQEELKEQKTVVKKMISNIKDEMTEMKKCLLILGGEENIAESISGCTAALEQSIQEALVWASPGKDDNAAIKDLGESQKCQDFI